MKINKKLFSNFSYLTIIQLITLLVPFLYYPYLIRKYDIEDYGLVIFIQSIVMLLAIIVDFGFNISGTRLVAENRDKKKRLNIIYSSITYIKLFLFLICFFILQFFIILNEKLSNHYLLSSALFLIVLGEALFSQWFYLGLEKIKYAACINLISRFFLLAFIFIGTNTTLGFYAFPLALVLSSILNGIASILFIRTRLDIKFVPVTVSRMIRDLTASYSFLLSRSVGVIILKLNTYFIGNYIGLTQVAYYDLAEKLINLALLPLNLLNQVIYPHIARTKNFKLTFNSIKILFTVYILAYPILYFFGKDIIAIFAGEDMLPAYEYLLILYLIPISSIFTYFLGNCYLILINKEKAFNNSIYFSAFLYSILIFLILIQDEFNIIYLCWAIAFNSIFTCVYRIFSSLNSDNHFHSTTKRQN